MMITATVVLQNHSPSLLHEDILHLNLTNRGEGKCPSLQRVYKHLPNSSSCSSHNQQSEAMFKKRKKGKKKEKKKDRKDTRRVLAISNLGSDYPQQHVL